MQATQEAEHTRALLVSIRTPKVTDADAEESLAELKRLVTTLGYRVIGTQSQRQPSTAGVTVVGEGKLKELARFTGGKGVVERAAQPSGDAEEEESSPVPAADVPQELATVVVFDCDLTPSQMRNVENALGVEVLDRTGVIIEIFSRHAKTRAAKLQVEIARLNYLAPRLRELGGGKERQSGRGSGESALELDRRKVRDRLAELKHELESVQQEQSNRRAQRAEQMCVVLVGYTNAGKSSTMRALTGSDVLVEDKLFATLDTTVRAMQPETQPRILVSDTVGFIKKLPHDLVASFRSTLDEARNASLLLYVVDAADATFRAQLDIVNEVLREVGVQDAPQLLLLNKSDRLNEVQQAALRSEVPNAMLISTRNPADIQALRERILQFAERDMVEEEIFVPYTAKGAVGEIRAKMRIVHEAYEAEGIRLRVKSKAADLDRLKKMIQTERG
ncbi:MAG: GTPase HflX [Gammaproteobacteria bacterium]|nr:GTPase HflX [Gammaproteobacteria bacterium]